MFSAQSSDFFSRQIGVFISLSQFVSQIPSRYFLPILSPAPLSPASVQGVLLSWWTLNVREIGSGMCVYGVRYTCGGGLEGILPLVLYAWVIWGRLLIVNISVFYRNRIPDFQLDTRSPWIKSTTAMSCSRSIWHSSCILLSPFSLVRILTW